MPKKRPVTNWFGRTSNFLEQTIPTFFFSDNSEMLNLFAFVQTGTEIAVLELKFCTPHFTTHFESKHGTTHKGSWALHKINGDAVIPLMHRRRRRGRRVALIRSGRAQIRVIGEPNPAFPVSHPPARPNNMAGNLGGYEDGTNHGVDSVAAANVHRGDS